MKTKRITVFGMICLLAAGLLFGYVQDVYAGSATVSVSASASNVTTGSNVTVTVGISADEPVGYGVAISYDTSILEYQGGGDNGGGGTVTILNEGDGATSSFSRTLTFKAVGNGSTTVSASAFAGGLFGYNTGDMAVTYGSAGITVSAPQSTEGNGGGNGNGGGEGSGNTTAPPSGSGDNILKSLEISPGTLSPAFQSSVTSYTVQLPEDTKSIVVSAVPNDGKAKVTVSHNNDLEPGANKTYIVVTAENGTQRTYVLNINCGEMPDEDEEGDVLSVQINGTTYTFATTEQMAEVELPEGFEAGEEEYEGKKITVYTSPNRLLQVVYLIEGEGNGQWFVYKKDQKTFLPYKEYQASANRYIILEPDESIGIPAGYAAMELEIQGQKVTVYAKDGQAEIVLIYAMKPDGEPGFYLYDTIEDTFLRYVESQDVVQEPVTTEESTEAPVVTEDEKLKNFRILLYILCGISLILAGVLAGVIVYFRKTTKQAEADSDFLDYDIPEVKATVPEEPAMAEETLTHEESVTKED